MSQLIDPETERQAIREAVRQQHARATGSGADFRHACNFIMLAITRARAGLPYIRPIGPLRLLAKMVGMENLRHLGKLTAAKANTAYRADFAKRTDEERGFPSLAEGERRLRLIEFGTLVLDIQKGGERKTKAMEKASAALDEDVVDVRTLYRRFSDFRKLVDTAGFVPHLEYDAQTGSMGFTKHVPSDLANSPKGRPREKL